MQDPFTARERNVEWLLTLKPAEPVPSDTASTESKAEEQQADPALRVSIDEFRKLASAGAVTIVDVRGDDSFAVGHIPGAISIPLESVAARLVESSGVMIRGKQPLDLAAEVEIVSARLVKEGGTHPGMALPREMKQFGDGPPPFGGHRAGSRPL